MGEQRQYAARITAKGLRFLLDNLAEEDPCTLCLGKGQLADDTLCKHCKGFGRVGEARVEELRASYTARIADLERMESKAEAQKRMEDRAWAGVDALSDMGR